MAARYTSMALILALCALAGGIRCVSGDEGHNHTTHNVGAQLGWTVPPAGYNYSTWAANETFYNGDSLFFKYNASRHAVFQVTQADYNNCTLNNCNHTSCNGTPLFSDMFAGNSNFTFDKEGDYWFICPVGPHCSLGMKFKATVKASPSAAAAVSAGLGTAVAAALVGLVMGLMSL